MRTVVLDDDPTGTQSATGVEVLLEWDVDVIEDALREAPSVYILTNTRSLTEAASVALLTQIREQCREVAGRLGDDVTFVLRGDSTLRGHVFAETEVFASEASLIAFVPAFPAGGRLTLGGVHHVRVGEDLVPAEQTEYAADPVFPFDTAVLVDYVGQRSARSVVAIDLDTVRSEALAGTLARVPDGRVLVFDVETDGDVVRIAAAIRALRATGRDVVIRSAATLAAELAEVRSDGFLAAPIAREPGGTLVVCGSHTEGARRQLEPIAAAFGEPVVVDTEAALAHPEETGGEAGRATVERMGLGSLGFVTTARDRAASHGTLDHGERVMRALTSAVAQVAPHVTAVVSKGGITSADVARVGLGARRARVRGQIMAGVSVWDLQAHDGHGITYVVVPGNVGVPSTIADALATLGVDVQAASA